MFTIVFIILKRFWGFPKFRKNICSKKIYFTVIDEGRPDVLVTSVLTSASQSADLACPEVCMNNHNRRTPSRGIYLQLARNGHQSGCSFALRHLMELNGTPKILTRRMIQPISWPHRMKSVPPSHRLCGKIQSSPCKLHWPW